MLSDTTDAYTEEKLEIIQKTLPPLTTCTAETGPLDLDFPAYTWTKLHGFAVQSHDTPVEMEDVNLKDAYDMAGIYPTMDNDHPFSSLWSFHMNHAGETWCVVGRIATIPLKACKISLEHINLDPTQRYHVFDFWKETYLGIVEESINVRELGLGECQILAFRKVKEVPQFVASTRHVSMDAISVQKCMWIDGKLQMSFEGIPGTSERYYFAVPEEYMLGKIESEGGTCTLTPKENIMCLEIAFQKADVNIVLSF